MMASLREILCLGSFPTTTKNGKKHKLSEFIDMLKNGTRGKESIQAIKFNKLQKLEDALDEQMPNGAH